MGDRIAGELQVRNGHASNSPIFSFSATTTTSTNMKGVDAVVDSQHQQPQYRVEYISSWTHPGTAHLSLPALCVEANALRPSSCKWIMPRAIVGVQEELKNFGVYSATQLADRLASGFSVKDLVESTTFPLVYLDEHALSIFRVLLQVRLN